MEKIIAYRLEPVYELPAGYEGVTTAALMQCMATGKVLDGMGGGGMFLSPEVVETLRGGGFSVVKDEPK